MKFRKKNKICIGIKKNGLELSINKDSVRRNCVLREENFKGQFLTASLNSRLS